MSPRRVCPRSRRETADKTSGTDMRSWRSGSSLGAALWLFCLLCFASVPALAHRRATAATFPRVGPRLLTATPEPSVLLRDSHLISRHTELSFQSSGANRLFWMFTLAATLESKVTCCRGEEADSCGAGCFHCLLMYFSSQILFPRILPAWGERGR